LQSSPPDEVAEAWGNEHPADNPLKQAKRAHVRIGACEEEKDEEGQDAACDHCQRDDQTFPRIWHEPLTLKKSATGRGRLRDPITTR
jgi:hypothetical protein